MKESEIEREVCAYAKRKGWLVYKFVSPGRRGVPDRIFIKRGSVAFIEFKAPGKKPTRLQFSEMAKLRENCVNATYIDDIQKGKELIDFYEEGITVWN